MITHAWTSQGVFIFRINYHFEFFCHPSLNRMAIISLQIFYQAKVCSLIKFVKSFSLRNTITCTPQPENLAKNTFKNIMARHLAMTSFGIHSLPTILVQLVATTVFKQRNHYYIYLSIFIPIIIFLALFKLPK